ncbi:MAG: hypothetical protein ACT6FG_06870 [Methanosarcinaceae archaeon]
MDESIEDLKPILAEAYADETAVIDRVEKLKTDTNPEYDEVDVFDAQLR